MTTTTSTIPAADPEGFLLHPEEWTEELVPALAQRDGIDVVSDEHWLVIRFMREQWRATGSGPSVRALSKASGVSIKRLYELFPTGPAKTAARIAGIPKPRGCI